MEKEVTRKFYGEEEVNEIIKNFPEKLFADRVVITANPEESDDLNLSENTLDIFQYVIAVGDIAERHGLEPGDRVRLDLHSLMKRIPSGTNSYETEEVLDLEPFMVNGETFALINSRQLQSKCK